MAALALVLFTASSCTTDPNADPASSGDEPGTLLAFSTSSDGFVIARITPQGAVLQTWPAQGLGLGFRVSPDGSKLVSVELGEDGRELVTLDLSSGVATTHPTSLDDVDWAEDGRLLGFESIPDSRVGFATDDGAGLDPTHAVEVSGAGGVSHFSLDEVLLTRSALMSSNGSTVTSAMLLRMGLDGTPGPEYPMPDGCNLGGWDTSPDHGRIAVSLACTTAIDSGLFVIDSTTGQMTRVVQGVTASPSWSSDGKHLAYSASDGQPSIGGFEDLGVLFDATTIWTVEVSTSKTRRITGPDWIYFTPQWTPAA